MLLFDPEPPDVRWSWSEGGQSKEGRCAFGAGWAQRVAEAIAQPAAPNWIGYVLRNGGEIVTEPVSRLLPEGLGRVKQTIELLPEHNDLSCQVAQEWLARRPEIPHLLLCETGFFSRLPPEAGLYAVPYELRKHGLKRYGGYGLCHQWAWREVDRLRDGQAPRVVSVYLGDQTNMAAIRDGLPVDTTIGFSTVEGIISATACGDIDPTVVFQMQSEGMTLEQIGRLLSAKSGFTGLMGRRAGLLDVLSATADPQARLAKDMLRYGILRHIGACIAVLGGVDALAFATPHRAECLGFVAEICRALACVGVRSRTGPIEQGAAWELTDPASPAKAFCLDYNKWQVLAGCGSAFLLDQGDRT